MEKNNITDAGIDSFDLFSQPFSCKVKYIILKFNREEAKLSGRKVAQLWDGELFYSLVCVGYNFFFNFV